MQRGKKKKEKEKDINILVKTKYSLMLAHRDLYKIRDLLTHLQQ